MCWELVTQDQKLAHYQSSTKDRTEGDEEEKYHGVHLCRVRFYCAFNRDAAIRTGNQGDVVMLEASRRETEPDLLGRIGKPLPIGWKRRDRSRNSRDDSKS